MYFGLLELPLWGYVVITLMMTHITIAAITIYLHRHQAHRALDLHPVLAHAFRFWLWLTTGTVTKEWVAVHRKHHARVETKEDPHSPQIHGIRKVLLEGYELYRAGANDREALEKYGHGTPDDWMERKLYSGQSFWGVYAMLAIDLVLFGVVGLIIWAVQMLWQPVLAAGVINGVGHWGGYRNFEVPDASKNIVPWGILIGGEELHNNHHAFPSSARLSNRWWELDIGWLYIRLFEMLGLARVKKVQPPEPALKPGKARADLDTLRALLTHRFQVMSRYAQTVLARVHAEEVARAEAPRRGVLRSAKRLLWREESLLSAEARRKLERALEESYALKVAYDYRRRLQAIWQERGASQERLLQALEEWCRQAEASGIRALQEFARTLPSYSLRAA